MRSWLLALLTALLMPATAAAQVVEYYHLDALGSVRAITNQSGAVVETHDYLPFGEEWAPPTPRLDNQPIRFTGKERDDETGLDYFGARYYGARIARFTTVDPVYTWGGNLVDPQRWNRYSYVLNNPLRHVDPDGRTLVLVGPPSTQRNAETIANSGLFGQDLSIGRDGKATLRANGEVGPPTPEQAAMADLLGAVISDKLTTTISLSSGSPTTITGSFDRQDIDVADMAMFGGGPAFTMAGKFGHEVSEQYVKQVKGGKDFDGAHAAALAFENGITGWTRSAGDAGRLDASLSGWIRQTARKGGATVDASIYVTKGNITTITRKCSGSGCTP